MNENLSVILGIEAMCAIQGVQERAPLQTSPALQKAIDVFRSKIARLEDDRYMADDIKAAADLVANDGLAQAGEVQFSL